MKSTSNPNARKDIASKTETRTDHAISHHHRLNLRSYPNDCPLIRPYWFHAVDVPKRRPFSIIDKKSDAKSTAKPKKYAAFSSHDSRAIETAFQKLVEEEETRERSQTDELVAGKTQRLESNEAFSTDDVQLQKIRVPVNEDYLFEVDVAQRELAPAYWLGPVYDVRRGTWFYQDGSVQRPCDENLSAQLEEGYLKIVPWKFDTSTATQLRQRAASRPTSRPSSWALDDDTAQKLASGEATPAHPAEIGIGVQNDTPSNSYRLFGAHMNSVVTYQDSNTAWLMTDDFLSRMNYTMYQRFAGGGHFAGVKLTRGYDNPERKKAETESSDASATEDDKKKRPSGGTDSDAEGVAVAQSTSNTSETRRQTLARQMSELLEDVHESPEEREKERQRRDEREIKNDYRELEGDEQGREIEHLILVTHGIGQRLGLRLESVNFVHDVNALRKTLKSVYANSPDLRALNAELGNLSTVNSRIQVLPICWRHLLDFPKRNMKQKRQEHDIVDSDIDDTELPSLDDITVEGVPAVRNLVTDLALDILLYQSTVYKDHISQIVLSECNRIYRLFKERNPNFRGRVSLIGHSLGSAIMFDILCKQDEHTRQGRNPHRRHHHDHHHHQRHSSEHENLALDFEVADFYALGSPIGLFQMLNGQTVAARKKPSMDPTTDGRKDDPMLGDPLLGHSRRGATRTATSEFLSDSAVSRPKCSQIFNIFHPTDPIAYRIEPMISTAMASLKPQPLPYTKRGIFGGPVGQGLTGIGSRVSQSVSSMWSSVASNLLTRGLGYAGDTNGKPNNSQLKTNAPLSYAREASNAVPAINNGAKRTVEGKMEETLHPDPSHDFGAAGEHAHHPPTLIDANLETLYEGFQRKQTGANNDAAQHTLNTHSADGRLEAAEAEDRSRKLRREEQKVRRLNSNGRVDYAIQEGAFDINLIAAVASHLSYWTDEDVSHFIISQILSRYRNRESAQSKP